MHDTLLLRPFTWYMRRVYAHLARSVARDIIDYERSGIDVTGLVALAADKRLAGSPAGQHGPTPRAARSMRRAFHRARRP